MVTRVTKLQKPSLLQPRLVERVVVSHYSEGCELGWPLESAAVVRSVELQQRSLDRHLLRQTSLSLNDNKAAFKLHTE